MKVYLVTYNDAYTKSTHIIAAENESMALAEATINETGYSLRGEPVKPDPFGFKVYEIDGVYARSEGTKVKNQVY